LRGPGISGKDRASAAPTLLATEFMATALGQILRVPWSSNPIFVPLCLCGEILFAFR
jgi:hypothetical protein